MTHTLIYTMPNIANCNRFLVASAALAAIILSVSVGAQTRRAYDDYPLPAPSNTTAGARSGSDGYPQLDLNAVATASARLAAARETLARLDADMQQRGMALRASLETTSEYRSAQSELDTARVALESARRVAIDYLQNNNADYKSAVTERDTLNQVLQAGGLSREDRILTANKKLEYAKNVSKVESEAFAGDPKISEAQKRVSSAQTRLADLKSQNDQAIAEDTELKSMREQVGDARVTAAAAGGYLDGLQSAYETALQNYDQFQAAPLRTQQRNYSPAINFPYYTPYRYGYGYGYYPYPTVIIRGGNQR